ncbi:MAG: acetyl ornithine aminotransferase family protein [Caldilineaceae bacterium]|nr:acetyl ornithine aminotransferase family protein [Caldilineaceae bacterium]MBP8106865.1 acetyl ornithine aminotransferase family protein [Caldilineaceae bacterium]MBP8122445.1 acetyl ornithine aminotransferase family protein [Caldilineaceae bacterium]MBP9072233.1 acetyl ornithine aminotransferase family protein [Caldilineaceae bacterium]
MTVVLNRPVVQSPVQSAALSSAQKGVQIRTPLPGPKAAALIAQDEATTSPSLGRVYDLVPKEGEGCWVTDVDGNRFLDFMAGIAVCTTGHSHPRIVKAVQEQVARMVHICGADFYSPGYGELAAKLVTLAPKGKHTDPWRAFLSNSGTESVEGAIKLARYYTKRQRVIAFRGSFHGRTLGSLSLTASKYVYRKGFGPLLSGVEHIMFPNASDCPTDMDERAWGRQFADHQLNPLFQTTIPADEVAAIIVEPIQGEGGYIVPPNGFMQRLREICDEHGILLIADEVQSGFGRTGKMFAMEHWNVQPDIICMAKGIASGVPIGAFMAPAHIMSWHRGAHGSTWGGSPLGCAAALETIDLVETELMANAQRVGAHLKARCEELLDTSSLVADVRGKGLMIGIELVDKEATNELMVRCFHNGLLTLPAGQKVMRLSPPLILTMEEADLGFEILRRVLGEIEAERAA